MIRARVFRSRDPRIPGHDTTWCLRVGKARLSVSREVGYYGFPTTVSWALRWWWA